MPRVPLAFALSLALVACQSKHTAEPPRVTKLETEQQRVSYMVGLDVAHNLEPVKDEIDLAIVDQAIRDALGGKAPLLDKAAVDSTREAFTTRLREKREAEQRALAVTNLREGEAFLARNARQPNVRTTASGLQYEVLEPGRGAKPDADATVRINYIGKLLDGREFENTYAIDHPAELPLSQIVPGWREGLTLMPLGGKYRLWIPAALAYGERGIPGMIGPNATLVLEVELLEIAGQGSTQ